jgi:hypothetical protein
MLQMFFPALKWLPWAAGAALGAVVAAGPVYLYAHWKGDRAGYARAHAENVKASFDQIKERMETDAEVRDMDDAGLCALLGGRMHDGTCQ